MAPGINNRLAPTRLQTSDREGRRTFLSAAENIDIGDTGYVRRRAGTTVRFAGVAHSLWGDEQNAYAVLDGALLALVDGATVQVRSGMSERPLSYARGADGAVYWSDARVLRRIVGVADGPAATPRPVTAPVFSPSAGTLPAGEYLATTTVIGDAGESAAQDVQHVVLAAPGGIAVNDPALVGRRARVYLSAVNGSVLALAGETTTGTFTISAPPMDGMNCATLGLAEMPAGQIVRLGNGRLLVAAGAVLWYSEAYRYGLTRAGRNFVQFPADIAVAEATDSGIFIATTQETYWLTELGTQAQQMRSVLPYGATPGTSGVLDNDEGVFWHTDRGLVLGSPDGSASNVQEKALSFGHAARGASLLREKDGERHLLTTRAANLSWSGARFFMDAEIVRA